MTPRDPLESHSSTAEELVALNAIERTGQAFLAWRDQSGALQLQALDPDGETIGRGEGVSVRVQDDTRVSSLHAELRTLADQWVIVDDGLSRNGTFVDAERVTGRRRLHHNARIMVGDTLLAFRAGIEAGGATAPGGKMVQRADLQANELAVVIALCRPLVLHESDEPTPNNVIATEVHLSEDGVKRCLTRLYRTFEVADSATKRRLLAQRAVLTGVARPTDYTT